jgi:hypothetical protein
MGIEPVAGCVPAVGQSAPVAVHDVGEFVALQVIDAFVPRYTAFGETLSDTIGGLGRTFITAAELRLPDSLLQVST